MTRILNATLIGFPILIVLAMAAQVIGQKIGHDQAIQDALEQCYDSPDTTDAECEAFADSGAIWHE